MKKRYLKPELHINLVEMRDVLLQMTSSSVGDEVVEGDDGFGSKDRGDFEGEGDSGWGALW